MGGNICTTICTTLNNKIQLKIKRKTKNEWATVSGWRIGYGARSQLSKISSLRCSFPVCAPGQNGLCQVLVTVFLQPQNMPWQHTVGAQ